MSTESPPTHVGKPAKQVDAEAPSDASVAAALGMDITNNEDVDTDTVTVDESDGLIETLLQEIRDLQETVESQHQSIEDLAARNNELEERVAELEDDQERTRDIAKSASAKAHQLDADPEESEDAEALPHGVEPSSSQLDFLANCRQSKVKEVYVEKHNRDNTYRAVQVAKRWPEFATKRHDGTGVFMTKDVVTIALTAILGTDPHPQTKSRVWDKLVELGGDDLVEKTRQVSHKQSKTKILAMDMETANGLLDKRYLDMDLVEGSVEKAATGGVTPVVMGDAAKAL